MQMKCIVSTHTNAHVHKKVYHIAGNSEEVIFRGANMYAQCYVAIAKINSYVALMSIGKILFLQAHSNI